jgi:excisionase family DNA binding protein
MSKHEAQTVAPAVDRHKLEFNQVTAAAYACNDSGQISPRTIRRATEAGELHAVRVGHKWLYTRADVDAWLASKLGHR